MTNSLTEAYGNQNSIQLDNPKKVLGGALVSLSFLFIFIGILASTTGIIHANFNVQFDTVITAGVTIVGLSTLLLFTGVLLGLPQVKQETVWLWLAGTGLATLGVIAFIVQYPENWNIYQLSTIWLVASLYGLGIALVIYAVFRAIITVKVRNKPGGEVEVIIEEDGEQARFKVQRESAGRDTAEQVERALNESTPEGSKPTTTGRSSLGFIGTLPDEAYDEPTGMRATQNQTQTRSKKKSEQKPQQTQTKDTERKSERNQDDYTRNEEGYLEYR